MVDNNRRDDSRTTIIMWKRLLILATSSAVASSTSPSYFYEKVHTFGRKHHTTTSSNISSVKNTRRRFSSHSALQSLTTQTRFAWPGAPTSSDVPHVPSDANESLLQVDSDDNDNNNRDSSARRTHANTLDELSMASQDDNLEGTFPSRQRVYHNRQQQQHVDNQQGFMQYNQQQRQPKEGSFHHHHHNQVQDDIDDEEDEEPSASLVYRYYARRSVRPRSAGSIPFLLLGPNVDHWKVAAQELAERGFSVMACEREAKAGSESSSISSSSSTVSSSASSYDADIHEGIRLVQELLDSLRWNKVILVASDSESWLAIQLALHLAPERVVGLVLCGNLHNAETFIAQELEPRERGKAFAVDRFLTRYLTCPFTIAWDGEDEDADQMSSSSSSSSTLVSPAKFLLSGGSNEATTSISYHPPHRSLVIGGGLAPHRRRPQLFAWVLTRFVEEKIVNINSGGATTTGGRSSSLRRQSSTKYQWPFNIDKYFSSGSFVVSGRLIATVLFYAVVLKVTLFQFEQFRDGIYAVSSWPQKVSKSIIRFVGGLGSVFVIRKKHKPHKVKGKVSTEAAKESAKAKEDKNARSQSSGEEDNNNITTEGTDDSKALVPYTSSDDKYADEEAYIEQVYPRSSSSHTERLDQNTPIQSPMPNKDDGSTVVEKENGSTTRKPEAPISSDNEDTAPPPPQEHQYRLHPGSLLDQVVV